eukprot:TRINITY_DN39669_c0_g1_i1.p1 TRINITY_DN39669_c0_g1~~TRINITY_DN39669_c0_g1_i1.p1  ORF type:complete len:1317 (+),score=443.29 TRINITY_DN39669_c0_g1_i1:67-3951(+)
MASVIHSVSLADFDLHAGNTLSQTFPATVDLEQEVVQKNLHDLCFPDGAHEACRDTVFAVLDGTDGGQLFAVACYRAVRTALVKRGAVQRGLLVLCKVPLFLTLAGYLNKLLDFWLNGSNNPASAALSPRSPCMGSSTPPASDIPPLVLSSHGDPAEATPASPDDRRRSSWVDVAAEEPQPRVTTREMDEGFLRTLFESLVESMAGVRNVGTHLLTEVSFASSRFLPDAAEYKVADTLRVPLVAPLADVAPAGLRAAMGHGCDLRWFFSTFRLGVASIYAALLNRETVCFVGHGRAQEVGRAVLSCVHLVSPMWPEAGQVVPYFTVSDASKIESLPFCIAGSTNPFYEDVSRNRWATLICHVKDGTVTPTSAKEQARAPTSLKRLVQHLVQGVQDGRPEAWVRTFMEWHTARLVRDAEDGVHWSDTEQLPPLVSVDPSFPSRAAALAEKTERQLTVFTKCHEVAAAKLHVHVNWFASVVELLGAAADRGELLQREQYAELANLPVPECRTLEDTSRWACGSATETALTAQMAFEEGKGRRMIRRLRSRVHRLVDSMNWRNDKALRHDDNRSFSCTFNLPQFQLYNLPYQVVLHSASCSLALKVCDELDDTAEPLKTTGRLWVSKNYFAFKAGWLSRRKAGKDKAHTVEVIPFDIVRSVLRTPHDCSIMSDGLRVSLPGVQLYVGGLHDTFRTAALLQTLVEKQRKVQHTLTEGFVVAVPEQHIDVDDPLSVTRRMVIPCGLYLYDRCVREEVWELQRNYPIVGWSGKLLPTDPPGFCDWSGHRERRFDSFTLPPGWRWLGEWAVEGVPSCGGAAGSWEYSSDFKKGGWKDEGKRGKLDICRRRCWTRDRVVEKDQAGEVLPPPPSRTDGLQPVPSGPAAAARAAELQGEAHKLTDEQARLRAELNPKWRARLLEIKKRLVRIEQESPAGPLPDVAPLLQRSPDDAPVDAAEFKPAALLPENMADLRFEDFVGPDGELCPFHASGEMPGCGSAEVAAGLGYRQQLLQAEDELLAETQGILQARRRGHSLSPARIREDFRDFRENLKADLKQSFGGAMRKEALPPPAPPGQAAAAGSEAVNQSFSAADAGQPSPTGSHSPSPTALSAKESKHRWRSPPRSRGVVLVSEQDRQRAREERERSRARSASPAASSQPSPRSDLASPKVHFAGESASSSPREGTSPAGPDRAAQPTVAQPQPTAAPSAPIRIVPPPPLAPSRSSLTESGLTDSGANYPIGEVVEVHSLQRLAELNGKRGTVVGHVKRAWDGEQCIVVALECSEQKLRPKNLRVVGRDSQS